jgi:hypothetical protein
MHASISLHKLWLAVWRAVHRTFFALVQQSGVLSGHPSGRICKELSGFSMLSGFAASVEAVQLMISFGVSCWADVVYHITISGIKSYLGIKALCSKWIPRDLCKLYMKKGGGTV